MSRLHSWLVLLAVAGISGLGAALAGGCTSPSTMKGECPCSAPTPVCDQPTQTCVACHVDKDCTDAARPNCDIANHACVDCFPGCSGDKPICDAPHNTCYACLIDANCNSPSQICVNHSCIEGCDQNKPCATGVCDLPNKACVACLADSNCSSPSQICVNKACVNGCDANKPCTT